MSDFNWKSVWEKKGRQDTLDLVNLDGFEKTNIDPKGVAANIKKCLNINEDHSVLEVGCGAGMLSQFFPKNYWGVDYSYSLIQKHLSLFGNSVVVASANDLPFKLNQFDFVFAYSVFHYFPTHEYALDAISEMKRVARKGIFIGDLPSSSHDQNHLLFKPEEMIEFSITSGYYTDKRFNAYLHFS